MSEKRNLGRRHRKRKAEVLVCQRGHHPTAGCTREETRFYQKRFVYIFQRVSLFAHGHGHRIGAHGPPPNLVIMAVRIFRSILSNPA